MKRPIVYIAGPDVFKENVSEIYNNYVELCQRYDASCLYPNDSTIEPADTAAGFALNIYRANIQMMGKADFVLVNVDPFRGPSMDVGAAFEIGYAAASGIPIIAFSSRPLEPYFERLVDYHGQIVETGECYRSQQEGLLLENFGLSDNLMIAHATDKKVHAGFESALKQAIALHKEKAKQPTAHHLPEKEFPTWLKAFDHANDQHDVTLKRLNFFLDGMRQKMPASWRTLERLNVLDLACGDGRFSRRIIDLIEKKLDLKVSYAALELNGDFVHQAQDRFPDGMVLQGNIFEEIPDSIGRDFKPHLILLSHAIYFAKDMRALVEKLALLGTVDTLTMYLLNDPIYRQVPRYIDDLTDTVSKLDLPFTVSNSFRSYVYFPEAAREHIASLASIPQTLELNDDTAQTRHLLSFFQQTPIAEMEPELKNRYLDRVQRDLSIHEGKVPVQNHCLIALHPDSSIALKEMSDWAVKYMDVVTSLKAVLSAPASIPI